MEPTKNNPYAVQKTRPRRGRIARAGMSAAEMVFWLVTMAVLAVAMLLLLWHASR